MTDYKVSQALKDITIIVDTREHDTPEFRARVESFPCPVERAKLDFGDYSIKTTLKDGTVFSLADKVAVERKMSIDEICGNFGTNRDRFEREFDRMKKAGGKAMLVVEGGSYSQILAHRYRSQLPPQTLLASFCSWEARYGSAVHFCNAKESPIVIYNLLFYELRERLKNYEPAQDERGMD